MKSQIELVRLFISERLEKVPKVRMLAAEKAGRLSELRMLQVIAGKPEEEPLK